MDNVQIVEITYAKPDGEILGTASVHVADLENFREYQVVGGRFNPDLYYIKNRKPVLKPPVPDFKNQAYYVFNYSAEQWEINPDLTFVRELKWNEIKQQRDQMEFGGFDFQGKRYDSDQTAQGRIMGAVIAGQDQVWTLQDNTVQDLTADDLKGLYASLQQHIASAHSKGRQAREAIEQATTPDEIMSVSF